jgi:glycosyltransferase involved in cell wall biosynthesis
MNGICILTETFYPVTGGGETQALAMATGFSRMGYEVCVMTRRSDKTLSKFELLEGVRIYRIAPSGTGQLKKWTLLLTALGALIRHRKHYRFIIVSGFRILGIPAMLVAILLGKRTILKADNMGEMSGEYFRDGLVKIGLKPGSPPVRLFLYLRNSLLKKCRRFVAISSPVKHELENQGVPASDIVRIPNSVDTDRFCPASEAGKREIRNVLGIPEDAFVVIYTGRLVDYKGLPLLLRVWREVNAGYGETRLLLVGAGGMDIHNCENDLELFVRENGLAHCVTFVGSVDNVQTYLQASDVFVLPTEREAFGISLIEAMACGLPVIATRAGGIPDILHHDVDGCLIPVNNLQQLRASLDRLYDDEQLRRCFGRRARNSVVQRFSEQAVLNQYLQLLESLDAKNSTGARI